MIALRAAAKKLVAAAPDNLESNGRLRLEHPESEKYYIHNTLAAP